MGLVLTAINVALLFLFFYKKKPNPFFELGFGDINLLLEDFG